MRMLIGVSFQSIVTEASQWRLIEAAMKGGGREASCLLTQATLKLNWAARSLKFENF